MEVRPNRSPNSPLEHSGSEESDSCMAKIAEYLGNESSHSDADTLLPQQDYPQPVTKRNTKKLRPGSARAPVLSTSAQSSGTLALLSQRTCDEAIRSINSLFSWTIPTMSPNSKFSSRDKEEVHRFLEKKKKQFHESVRALAGGDARVKKQQLQRKNRRQEKKRESVLEKKFLAELERIRTAKRTKVASYNEMLKVKFNKAVSKYKRNRLVEQRRKHRELKDQKEGIKAIIIENITNFYQDKTCLLKDNMATQKRGATVDRIENSKVVSELSANRKTNRKLCIQKARDLLDLQSDQLAAHFQAAEKVEQKLLRAYSSQ